MSGWIKLHRTMLEWEWKDDPNVVALYLHLLLKANFTENKWRGITIKAGQIVTGRESLARETGLSIQQVRNALKKLKATSNITIKATNKFSIITVADWDLYQGDCATSTSKPTSKPTNKQPTNNQQTTTLKEGKKERRKESKDITPLPPKNRGNKNLAEKPDSISQEIWEDFQTLRKAKKAPLTKTALNIICKEADKAGITINEALQESCARGWQSFKAEWHLKNNQTKGNKHGTTYDTIAEQVIEELREARGTK